MYWIASFTCNWVQSYPITAVIRKQQGHVNTLIVYADQYIQYIMLPERKQPILRSLILFTYFFYFIKVRKVKILIDRSLRMQLTLVESQFKQKTWPLQGITLNVIHTKILFKIQEGSHCIFYLASHALVNQHITCPQLQLFNVESPKLTNALRPNVPEMYQYTKQAIYLTGLSKQK